MLSRRSGCSVPTRADSPGPHGSPGGRRPSSLHFLEEETQAQAGHLARGHTANEQCAGHWGRHCPVQALGLLGTSWSPH